MKRKNLFFPAALLLAVLLLASCSKEESVPVPATETESDINNGRCTQPGCSSPVTCTNRQHEICGVCGISKRPPRGCICGTGSGGSGGGNEPGEDYPYEMVRLIGGGDVEIKNVLNGLVYLTESDYEFWMGRYWVQSLAPLTDTYYVEIPYPLSDYVELSFPAGLRLKRQVPYTPYSDVYYVRHTDGRTLGAIQVRIVN